MIVKVGQIWRLKEDTANLIFNDPVWEKIIIKEILNASNYEYAEVLAIDGIATLMSVVFITAYYRRI